MSKKDRRPMDGQAEHSSGDDFHNGVLKEKQTLRRIVANNNELSQFLLRTVLWYIGAKRSFRVMQSRKSLMCGPNDLECTMTERVVKERAYVE